MSAFNPSRNSKPERPHLQKVALMLVKTFLAIVFSAICIYLLTLVIILWQPEDAENAHGVPTDRFEAAVTANGLMIAFLLSVFMAKMFSYLGDLFVEVSFQDVYSENILDTTIHKLSSYVIPPEQTQRAFKKSRVAKPNSKESSSDTLLL